MLFFTSKIPFYMRLLQLQLLWPVFLPDPLSPLLMRCLSCSAGSPHAAAVVAAAVPHHHHHPAAVVAAADPQDHGPWPE